MNNSNLPTKEEVFEILDYCKVNNISLRQRLAEVGIAEWRFYYARKRYLDRESAPQAEGHFIQLQSGSVVPASLGAYSRRKTKSAKVSCDSPSAMNIEIQTPRGSMLRMTGEMTPAMVEAILQVL